MIIAREIMDGAGRVLLQEGVVLTKGYIRGLEAKGYQHIAIRDANDNAPVPIDEDVPPGVYAQAVQGLRRVYDDLGEEIRPLQGRTAKEIGNAFDSDSIKALTGEGGPLEHVQEVAEQILRHVLTRDTLAGLTSIKGSDSHLFSHSVDVCAVSIMIGRLLGLGNTQLHQLAAGALLHDIGKLFLTAGVTGASRVIQHTKLGYRLLKQSDKRDVLAPHVAYEHHEHQDGSGLPRGLRGSNTITRDRSKMTPVPTLIAEIVAVANAYDNLLSGAETQEAVTTDIALKILARTAGKILNRSIVMTFLRAVPVYPQGAEVLIQSGKYRGYTAVVGHVHPEALDRPVIVVTKDNKGKRVEQEQIDLLEDEGIAIRCKSL